MTFQQVIDQFSNTGGQNIGIATVLMTLAVTFLLGVVLFMTYKKTYNNIAYNHSFNVSIVIMSLITATIILTIRSNLVLSLGMVGALSIVRFRSAIKDPMDIVYLFWAISVGITTGAQLYFVAIIATVIIASIIFVMMQITSKLDIFLLIINYEEAAEMELLDYISKLDQKLKSKRVTHGNVELTLEIQSVQNGTVFVDEISRIIGVENVSFVSYSGDFID